jgi:hypothetical protein
LPGVTFEPSDDDICCFGGKNELDSMIRDTRALNVYAGVNQMANEKETAMEQHKAGQLNQRAHDGDIMATCDYGPVTADLKSGARI